MVTGGRQCSRFHVFYSSRFDGFQYKYRFIPYNLPLSPARVKTRNSLTFSSQIIVLATKTYFPANYYIWWRNLDVISICGIRQRFFYPYIFKQLRINRIPKGWTGTAIPSTAGVQLAAIHANTASTCSGQSSLRQRRCPRGHSRWKHGLHSRSRVRRWQLSVSGGVKASLEEP